MNEDRATRYHRLKRQASVISLAWGVLLLAGLLIAGTSADLRDISTAASARIVPHGWVPGVTVLVYVALLVIVNEIASVPVGFYTGFVLERRYGLSNESLGAWALDQIKSFVLGLVLAWVAVGPLYGLIRFSPERWWLGAGVLFASLIVVMARLAPVLLLPLFYSVKPLGQERLRSRLLALADRAGARVLGAYEWGLAEKTKKANAALTGIGGTRRILVSDTMLAAYSEEEIEVVLAHELAHHVHGDIWKGIALQSSLILAGFYVAARMLAALAARFALDGPGDIAGLPLLLLSAGAVSLATVPLAHAWSRANERRADRFALNLTNNPSAFVSAMKRLGAQNLAEENPSKMVQWLFYSHPPLRDRIAVAQAFGRHA